MSTDREQETNVGRRGIVVHEVEEVYIYIPAEISAAGFELQIGGVVRVEDRVSCILTFDLGRIVQYATMVQSVNHQQLLLIGTRLSHAFFLFKIPVSTSRPLHCN